MLAFLLLASTSALGADYEVGIGDDCNFPVGPQLTDGCFTPDALTITVGDSVTFFDYADSFETGPHNVVADDGSFRCAAGCDGEGGDGTPRGSLYGQQWRFTRTFNIPGVVRYHDEAGGATGEITVQPLPPAAFAIGPGITGAWYDPAQSGHGLVVEVLPGNRFYASWFAFNPAGTEQAWFTGIGSYSGNTAMIVSVVMPSGGRWIPNFDPKQIIPNPWGTLTFTFTDCNHGRVDFSSVIAGYGTGSMDLTRLTQPAGLACP
jgi:plastocyanin